MADDPQRTVGHEVPEALLRLAVESLPHHAFVTLDARGAITTWNTGAARLLGWTREQAMSTPVAVLLGPGEEQPGIGATDLEQARRQGIVTRQRKLTHRDGTVVDAATTLLALRSDDDIAGYVVVADASIFSEPRDRSGGSKANSGGASDAQLAEARTLLAAEIAERQQAEVSRARLLRRLIVVQEEERRRLAQNLHDNLGQRLTALRLLLEGLNQERPGDGTAQAAHALEMLARIDCDIDFIAWELRPAALDELGLAKVLDAYVREWSRQAGVAAIFHARPGNLERFPPEVEATVYRIVQEALTNVSKHARARSVNVLLELRDTNLAIVVEDDGIGFQPAGKDPTMIGLTGMQERALAVGGTVEVEPTPGGGTTILACIPTSGASRERLGASVPGVFGEPDAGRGALGESNEASGDALNAIRARLQELHRAVAARDEFIATVAHELRNPIAPLTFQVRIALIKAEQLAAAGTPVSVEWIQTQLRGVEQRLHRLLETLDRLLDVSRLSTGRIDLQLESMNLGDAVRDVVDVFEAELAVARCKLTLSERAVATGSWDRLRVEQVLRNLLSNAIRFGAGRPIDIVVDADRDFARVVVRDHGVGIASDQQAKIFERFERGVEQRSGGFGIGLWIVRNICVAMGGAVSVESTLGEGACFTVMLPRPSTRQTVGSTAE
jgi:PAS domain S-box-containing protein